MYNKHNTIVNEQHENRHFSNCVTRINIAEKSGNSIIHISYLVQPLMSIRYSSFQFKITTTSCALLKQKVHISIRLYRHFQQFYQIMSNRFYPLDADLPLVLLQSD
jgi:hypothetical protein